MSDAYHTTVLLHKSIEALITDSEGTYADATFGGGGHSREILVRLGKRGKLFAFDHDEDAVQNLFFDSRFVFIRQNFRHLQKFLRVHGITELDGIIADLGVSSHQFDEAERGFSNRFDAALDMRMDKNQPLTAYMIVNRYSQRQLQNMFSMYGEVRNAKTLASAIEEARAAEPVNTTGRLREIATRVAIGERNRYLSQVFQAIRLEVNDEMGALKALLQSSVQLLKPGGRLVIISYHSLEDRMVKNFMKTGSTEGESEEDLMGRKERYFQILTKKPLEPDEAEINLNPRARSARMRVAERVN